MITEAELVQTTARSTAVFINSPCHAAPFLPPFILPVRRQSSVAPLTHSPHLNDPLSRPHENAAPAIDCLTPPLLFGFGGHRPTWNPRYIITAKKQRRRQEIQHLHQPRIRHSYELGRHCLLFHSQFGREEVYRVSRYRSVSLRAPRSTSRRC